MRRSDEFLGVGADAVFEARAEGLLGVLENAAVAGNVAFARFQVATPDGGSFAINSHKFVVVSREREFAPMRDKLARISESSSRCQIVFKHL